MGNDKWPKLIRITPGKGVELDGKEFPWYITEDGCTVNVGSRSELSSVTLTIPCDRVEMADMTAHQPRPRPWSRSLDRATKALN